MNAKFYVYAHSKSSSGLIDDVFYIGKGTTNRAKSKSNRNKFWNNIVNKNEGKFYIYYLQKNLIEEDAYFFEKLYIEIFGKRIENGLLVNMTDGGEGTSGRKLSDETKRKISEAHKGKVRPEYVKEKLRIFFSSDKNPNIGRKASEQTKINISLSKKGKNTYDKHWNWKGNIYQYDKNMNLIAIYNSSRDAEEKTGIKQSSIRSCVNNSYGRKTAGNFIWKRLSVKQV